jgi:hypothetical protein
LGLGLSVAACVGDTATPAGTDSGTAGEEGSACYPDETCNKNKPWLKCLSKLCVNVGADGGADATTDGSGTDATTDGGGADANDGSVTCPSQQQSTANTVRCVNGSPCNQICCKPSNIFSCVSTCSGSADTLGCDDRSDCQNNMRCCLAAQIAQLACPVVLQNTGGSTCITQCPPSAVELCGLGDVCSDGKTCVTTRIGANEYGVCVQ